MSLQNSTFRVLAESIQAPLFIPSQDNSLMDGFALNACSLESGIGLRLVLYSKKHQTAYKSEARVGKALGVLSPQARANCYVVLAKEAKKDVEKRDLVQIIPFFAFHLT